jgi:DNA replication protein DnaC
MEYFRGDLTPQPSVKVTRGLLEGARIPKALWNCNLGNIPERLVYGGVLRNYVSTMHQSEKEGKSLYLHGIYGRGKSGAAVAVAKEALSRGGRVIFVSALELEAAFGKESDFKLKNAMLRTHFLILDDLGAEKAIPWSPQWVETVIKLRNNDSLPTIITSNDKPLDFMGRIKSVASILGGNYQDIFVEGHDWRMDGKPSD